MELKIPNKAHDLSTGNSLVFEFYILIYIIFIFDSEEIIKYKIINRGCEIPINLSDKRFYCKND